MTSVQPLRSAEEADVDEPLAENYVHVAVAVAQNLYADASGRLTLHHATVDS